MDRVHYKISGIANENIKTQVKNSLEKVDGVNQVCLDVARGTIEVIYNKPATEIQIKSCLENSGHIIE
ncbi:heavy-metal-associated domain-containing protein [Clostridium nigeriense]|uniref:heavy-metal-associated domain-containing protein n=1 Tax=Clostridium nigeriense TaxID=1805470 RepID=UPI003D3450F0